MDVTFLIGLLGSITLVIGAALDDHPVKHDYELPKDWFFAVGAVIMLAYSILNAMNGGPVFFIFLEGLVTLSSAFMMLDVPERVSTPVSLVIAVVLMIVSAFLGHDATTLIFILGLAGVAIGYELKAGTIKRELTLAAGSALITVFSFLSATWIFFWLNLFFAILSLVQVGHIALQKREKTLATGNGI